MEISILKVQVSLQFQTRLLAIRPKRIPKHIKIRNLNSRKHSHLSPSIWNIIESKLSANYIKVVADSFDVRSELG